MALFAAAGGMAHAAPSNSFAVGMLGQGGSITPNCLASGLGGVQLLASNCDGASLSGGYGAGFASYTPLGTLGAYAVVTDADTVRLGTNGADMLTLNTNNGITASAQLNMSGKKISGVAQGAIANGSLDVVNGGQMFALSSSVASSLSTLTTNVSSLSTSVGTLSTSVDSLSTTVGTVSTGLLSLSSSTAIAVTSLSTGIDALSSSTSTTALSLSTSIGKLSTSTATSVSSLSTGVASLSISIANAVQYDADDHASLTLGGLKATKPVTLTNVANGAVTSSSTDAVNGSQLFTLASETAAALGGDASVDSNGKLTPPSYKFKDNSTFNNVGDALTNIDGRVTQNTNDITTINNQLNDITTGVGIKYFHANSTLADSSASGANSIAIGGNAQATADNSVALGSNSTSDRANTVSVGAQGQERQIVNVKAGEQDTDAVNVAQLHQTAQSVADALGGGASVDSNGNVTAPTYTLDGGKTFTDVGDALTNIDGRVTQNTNDITTINNQLNDITTGVGIKYFHASSTLPDSAATGADSVAIGGNAQATAQNSVALGSNSVADRANTVSVGSAGQTRQITNVAAGTEDTDAVNVAQLKSAGLINNDGSAKTAVTYDTASDGTTDYGNITLNSGGTVIHNVADGVSGTDAVNMNQMNAAIDKVANIADSGGNPMFAAQGDRNTEAAVATGTHATAMGANAQASADNSVALGANSLADRANTVSVGSAGNERQITNVANGTADTDAVNVRQLNLSAAQAQAYTDGKVAGLQGQINNVASTSYGGVAAAMAMAGLPQPTAAGKTMVSVAGARYSSASGAALGVSYVTEDERWVVKVAGSTSTSGNMGVTVGAGHQW